MLTLLKKRKKKKEDVVKLKILKKYPATSLVNDSLKGTTIKRD
jgi:hypothetical protein